MKKALALFYPLSLIIVFSLSGGCKKSSSSTPASSSSSTPPANEVWMQNTAFNPSSITVTVNTTVKWTNKDGMAHTVTSNTGLFDSGTVNSGGTYTHQFTTAGTFAYHCTIHSGMNGEMV